MARRKKEPRAVHRQNIATAAEELFTKKGIEATSMDEIAQKAGYSKATLYVYFQNKEEIVGLLVLESMKKLYDYIVGAIQEEKSMRERYLLICQGLVRYQEKYPFYFQIVLKGINVNFEQEECLPEEEETFRIGEELNLVLKKFVEEGIAAGEFRQEINSISTVFAFWGMLSGLIQLAVNKEEYIKKAMNQTKQEFLQNGFDTLYHTIAKEKQDE
ncbi:MAG: TetR/AcrR family transcriptional regulator [Clostridiales bacterium]|uniref:TetR/AcrR family transcriptional regulator n=1 Tax=Roseburia sp. MSJ-14 TaxID=2841514 RepID=UPI0016A4B1A7|nr:TetR/AcrR family transcriptional regulator [Roseburia sp. MSJ-14]NLK76968.1 TetR/AcrR family transcriptional regulator [Clostridiales bacterium]